MAAPTSVDQPDYAASVGVASAVLADQTFTNQATLVSVGPLDVSSFNSLTVFFNVTGGTAPFASVLTYGFANVLDTLALAQALRSMVTSPLRYGIDSHVTWAPLLRWDLSPVGGGNFTGRFVVMARNGTAQPVNFGSPLIVNENAALGAGLTATVIAPYAAAASAVVKLSAGSNNWAWNLDVVDVNGVWRGLAADRSANVVDRRTVSVVLPPHLVRLVVQNNDAAASAVNGYVTAGG